VSACLIIRALLLEIELQRKLNVSCRLRSLNNSSGGYVHRRIGYGKVDAVKRIQEVRAELHSDPFCDLEVFLQADIPIVESWAAQTTELRRASSESGRRVRIVVGVKPEISTTGSSRSWAPTEYSVCSVAVRAKAA